ncbi:hypothetical protein AVEN_103322-1 [Araneus ventricosus]|uniref:Mutator-like transposase domain-containing protein n=1 Tax=Araneus ventricosus TaxID=182803 RepID=A0A4Y2LXN9_ARAVE|nr:hypothetical protein AVEN_103322-1 [Araneus ventricosus]
MNGFTSTAKIGRKSTLNSLLVLGLRLIGKGFTAGKKLLCTVNLPFMSKSTFRRHEDQLLKAVRCAADKNMKEAATEVRTKTKTSSCGVSVDGTWQRRGHNSLNGCVSAISIDTGKVLDLEPMSLYCRYCDKKKNNDDHVCSNHVGSSASMETVGAYRIFDRSKQCKRLKYTKYYGDGDSNGFNAVKDIYGPDSVEKLECIGHDQKRVGSKMHKQCPKGGDSWCKYQRAVHEGKVFVDKSPGLPNDIINSIKTTYMSLCDSNLLSKCLHGKTQNNNKSFNNVIWTILPKETFVEMQSLTLGVNIAVLLFNSGNLGLLDVFKNLGVSLGQETVKNFSLMDSERVKSAKRHSLPTSKLSRKKGNLSKRLNY